MVSWVTSIAQLIKYKSFKDNDESKEIIKEKN